MLEKHSPGSVLEFRRETNFNRSIICNLVWGILRNKKNLGDSLIHLHGALDTPFSKVVTSGTKN